MKKNAILHTWKKMQFYTHEKKCNFSMWNTAVGNKNESTFFHECIQVLILTMFLRRKRIL